MSNDFFATIYTDASYCHETKLGAYSFYIRTSKGKIYDSGNQKDMQDVNHAEMYAIFKAIDAAIAKWPELGGVFINTDSLICCHILWPFRNTKEDHKSTRAIATSELIKQIIGERWIRAKHVKAHTGGSDIRSRVNRLVDKRARKTLRDAR